MESSQVRRVLIVANRTAATPTLLDHVKRLAGEQPSAFSLLIPDVPRSEHTDWTMELASPLLERAARGPVEGLTGEQDASTLPRRVSKWLRRDLAHRVGALGVPVTVVTPDQERLRDDSGAGLMGPLLD